MSNFETFGTALEGARRLLGTVSDTAGLDAQTLLAEASGRDRAWILAHPEARLEPGQAQVFNDWVDRLRRGEALPYVLGWWEFYGRRFIVDPSVLIPRPETELLIEVALAFLRERSAGCRVWDIGTGSGCIGITLAADIPGLVVVATDISMAALRVASSNASEHGVSDRVSFLQADLAGPMRGPVDLICANLPYVSRETIGVIPVSRREPRTALDGGGQGLEILGLLLSSLPRLLAPGGRALLEIGCEQGPQVLEMARYAMPSASATIRSDLSGRDRLMVVDLGR